jgi:DHA1 family inner membrane transport protein
LPPILFLFSAVNLVIGTSAFALPAILGPVAAGLGVGVAAAGQAVTAYAIAIAVLAPAALVLTRRWPRKRVLLASIGVFALGTAVCALAPSLPVLLLGRVLMGVGAVFTPVAAGITLTLVAPGRQGQALALVFLGMSLSYVVGMPVVAWIGLEWGWRAALASTTLLALIAWLGLAVRVPRAIAAPGVGFAGLAAVLRRADVLAVLALTLVFFVAIFCVFSYIGPVLQALVPMSPGRLSLTLSLFGVAGVAGTLLGGAGNDRIGALRTLWVQMTVLGTMMALLPFTAGNWPLMMTVMVVWGMAGFGTMAPQQSRLATMAPREAPLLLSLNSSMLYFGMAGGATLGGAAAPALGFERLSWVGVVAVALGLALLALGPRGRAAPGRPPS